MTMSPVYPFHQFGQQHMLALLIIAFLTALLPFVIKKISSDPLTRTIAVTLGSVLLLSKLAEPVVRVESWSELKYMLPLHLCDIGAIVAGIMLINRNYRLYEITYFWAFGGTLQALLTPELQKGFPSVDYFFYFFSHGVIIVSAIYATVLFVYRPTLRSIPRTFLVTLFYAVVIAPVNWLLDTNYLYLCRKPFAPSLLDYLGPWPWYLLALIPVALAFFFLYYSPFWIADLIKARRQ